MVAGLHLYFFADNVCLSYRKLFNFTLYCMGCRFFMVNVDSPYMNFVIFDMEACKNLVVYIVPEMCCIYSVELQLRICCAIN